MHNSLQYNLLQKTNSLREQKSGSFCLRILVFIWKARKPFFVSKKERFSKFVTTLIEYAITTKTIIKSFTLSFFFFGSSLSALSTPPPPAPIKPAENKIESKEEKPANFADQVLQSIVEDQEELLLKIKNNPKTFSETEKEMNLASIIRRYDVFTTENPNNVYGFILYGKCLRMIYANSKAKSIFLKADELNDSLAIVKQQLANCFAEEGNYALALSYLLQAIELEPKTAQYHYQLGELLVTYHKEFLHDKILEPAILEKKMQEAFAEAAKLAPQERTFIFRYAESFYELEKPDWTEALKCWDSIQKSSKDNKEEDIIALNRARIFIKMEKFEDARKELSNIFQSKYEQARQDLLKLLPKTTLLKN